MPFVEMLPTFLATSTIGHKLNLDFSFLLRILVIECAERSPFSDFPSGKSLYLQDARSSSSSLEKCRIPGMIPGFSDALGFRAMPGKTRFKICAGMRGLCVCVRLKQ